MRHFFFWSSGLTCSRAFPLVLTRVSERGTMRKMIFESIVILIISLNVFISVTADQVFASHGGKDSNFPSPRYSILCRSSEFNIQASGFKIVFLICGVVSYLSFYLFVFLKEKIPVVMHVLKWVKSRLEMTIVSFSACLVIFMKVLSSYCYYYYHYYAISSFHVN